MPPKDRTRPATKNDSMLYLAKAREFLATMEGALVAQQWDGAGLAAIHSGISAGDAVLAYHGGIRSAGQDHRVAVDLLTRVMGPASVVPSRHLRRLVSKKNLVEYEQRRLSQTEAVELGKHARSFVHWAETQLPQG